VPSAAVPVSLLAVGAVVAVLLARVAAWWPGRVAASTPSAATLRRE
jgi:hypothetical protein